MLLLHLADKEEHLGNLVALSGRAMFDVDDVAFDMDAAPDERGPYYAWMLFTWKVNEMVPETFATNEKGIKVHKDRPAPGWITEEYATARVLRPPLDSDSKIMVQADDMRLYPVWDQAMQQVVAGGIHKH